MKATIIIILSLMILVVIAWFLAEHKKRLWTNYYINLRNNVRDSEVTRESYDEITQEFDSLDWNNEIEHKMKQSLWSGFQIRFIKYSKYKPDTIADRLNEINSY